MHDLLEQQLSRSMLETDRAPTLAEWQRFLAIVDGSYEDHDDECARAVLDTAAARADLQAVADAADRRSAVLLTLLNSLSTGVCVMERDGTVTLANATLGATLGCDPTDMDIMVALTGIRAGPGQGMDPLEQLREAIQNHEVATFSHILRDVSGHVQHLSLRLVPSAPDRIVLTVDDITGRVESEHQRQQMEYRLEHQQRLEAIGRLAGGIAHDFNNLLAGILVCTELLDEIDGEARDDILEIRKSALRGADMTRRLLSFSRQDAEDPHILDVNEVLRGLLGMLTRLLNGVNLELSFDDASCTVLIDPSDLEQIVMNLIVNAQHAIAADGKIVIETVRTTIDEASTQRFDLPPGDYVQLKVSDDGCGMSEATLARVFEPFYTTREQGVGHGLGLATVHGMVTTANGRVIAYSEVGMGTTFRVLLPITGSTPQAPELGTGLPHEHGLRILLLEDDPGLLHSTARLLGDAGHLVTETSDLAEAEEALGAREYDAILADLIIEGKEVGFQFAVDARRHRPDLGAVVVSGFSERLRGLVLHHRMVYLEKPIPAAALMQAIRSVTAHQVSTHGT